MLKLIWILLLTILFSCSSQEKRKPFMIISNKNYPDAKGAGIGLSGGFGFTQFTNSGELKLIQKNFTTMTYNISLGAGVRLNRTFFGISGVQQFSNYYGQTSRPDENGRFDEEKFRTNSQMLGVYFGVLTGVYAVGSVYAIARPLIYTRFYSTPAGYTIKKDGVDFGVGMTGFGRQVSTNLEYNYTHYFENINYHQFLFSLSTGLNLL